jgi:hypothetical protein
MKPSYKDTDQKWTIWDCPEQPFHHNKEFFRFAIQIPVYDLAKKSFEIYIRPSYTMSQDEKSLFTCVYEMEYEITTTDELLTAELLSDIILNDCYPCFVKAFDEQKKEFPAAKDLPPPVLNEEVRKAVVDGSKKALADSAYPK